MAGLVTKLVLLLALGVPLVVAVFSLPGLVGWGTTPDARGPRLFAVPSQVGQSTGPTPVATRYSPLDAAPPPTLGVPTRVPATLAPEAPASERVSIYNTGGIGAAVRAQPGQSQQIAGLREGEVVEVLERSQLGGAEWVKVRTPQGVEGWILGIVARTVTGTPGVTTPTPGRASQTPPPASVRTPGAGDRTHTVQPGDELRHIAASFGVTIADILAINEVADPDSLTVGQVLLIPG